MCVLMYGRDVPQYLNAGSAWMYVFIVGLYHMFCRCCISTLFCSVVTTVILRSLVLTLLNKKNNWLQIGPNASIDMNQTAENVDNARRSPI
jgi:hypothetical protein